MMMTTNKRWTKASTEFVVNLGGGADRSITEHVRFHGGTRFSEELVPDDRRLSAGLQFGIGRR